MDVGTDPKQNPIPVGFPLDGAYPLHLAMGKGNEKLVKTLLENGAEIDIEASDNGAATLLHWAAFFSRKGMVSLLIKPGAPIN